MDNTYFWIYLLLLAGSTYLIRAVPFAAAKRKITNRFVKSFLYYIPYAVLTAMTIPGVLYSTGSMLSAGLGLLVAIFFALKNKGLTTVALAASGTVLAVELVQRLCG